MRDFGILTLSRFPEIFKALDISIEKINIPAIAKVVVTSGDTDFSFTENKWVRIKGEEPFNFSRNVNLGLLALRGMDILLTNDDVVFTNAITPLIDIVDAHPHIGIISPQVIGGIGNRIQSITYKSHQDLDFFISKERLAFVCVYIRKEVLENNRLRLFDDRTFDGYGSEDDDYCYRVHQEGYKLAVTPKVVVKHGFEEFQYSSTFLQTMGQEERIRSMGEMRKRLVEKYS